MGFRKVLEDKVLACYQEELKKKAPPAGPAPAGGVV